MKFPALILIALFSIPAEAHEASNGAYATWCLAGTVAVRTGLEITAAKTGKRLPAGQDLAVSAVTGCAGGAGLLYSLTDHPEREASDEADLKEEPKIEIKSTEPFQE